MIIIDAPIAQMTSRICISHCQWKLKTRCTRVSSTMMSHKPRASRCCVSSLLLFASLLKEDRSPGQENKNRRAQMGDPAGQIQEKSRMLRIERIPCVAGEELACVVEWHEDHDEAAQHVDNRDPPAADFRSRNLLWVV